KRRRIEEGIGFEQHLADLLEAFAADGADAVHVLDMYKIDQKIGNVIRDSTVGRQFFRDHTAKEPPQGMIGADRHGRFVLEAESLLTTSYRRREERCRGMHAHSAILVAQPARGRYKLWLRSLESVQQVEALALRRRACG